MRFNINPANPMSQEWYGRLVPSAQTVESFQGGHSNDEGHLYPAAQGTVVEVTRESPSTNALMGPIYPLDSARSPAPDCPRHGNASQPCQGSAPNTYPSFPWPSSAASHGIRSPYEASFAGSPWIGANNSGNTLPFRGSQTARQPQPGTDSRPQRNDRGRRLATSRMNPRGSQNTQLQQTGQASSRNPSRRHRGLQREGLFVCPDHPAGKERVFEKKACFTRHRLEQHLLKDLYICPCQQCSGYIDIVAGPNNKAVARCSFCQELNPSAKHFMDEHYGAVAQFQLRTHKRAQDFNKHIRELHEADAELIDLSENTWLFSMPTKNVLRCCDWCQRVTLTLAAYEVHRTESRMHTARNPEHARLHPPNHDHGITKSISGLLRCAVVKPSFDEWLSRTNRNRSLSTDLQWSFFDVDANQALRELELFLHKYTTASADAVFELLWRSGSRHWNESSMRLPAVVTEPSMGSTSQWQTGSFPAERDLPSEPPGGPNGLASAVDSVSAFDEFDMNNFMSAPSNEYMANTQQDSFVVQSGYNAMTFEDNAQWYNGDTENAENMSLWNYPTQ